MKTNESKLDTKNLPKLFDLTGRIALVTGGAGLLGAEFCHTLAEAGAAVVVADIDERAAGKVTDTIDSRGGKAIPIAVDVTNSLSVEKMMDAALHAFSRLDILVNCAALDPKFDPQHGGHTSTFEDYP
ncbi:MAG: SDR family NAD(P)-dependent oxidoreductase, partial [Anaerolineaceae bacterium]